MERELTTKELVKRAAETLDKLTRETDNTQALDAYDDLCMALEKMP